MLKQIFVQQFEMWLAASRAEGFPLGFSVGSFIFLVIQIYACRKPDIEELLDSFHSLEEKR
jgi:hypothetical protein